MELEERDDYLNYLSNYYNIAEKGRGHTIFIMGDAGVGKTALVNYFVKQIEGRSIVYTGACDSLFTPRPLGPLYDIAAQIGQPFMNLLRKEKNRALLFSSFLQELSSSDIPVVLVIEDIHWADEATIDFIKFLVRRITKYKCLFLLTHRDPEINLMHPLRAIFAELPLGAFSKQLVNPLSRDAVNRLALTNGFASGEEVYSLTGGNPFYVAEVLANKSREIPERVKDSILNFFYSKSDLIRELLELLSILPSRIELSVLKHIENDFASCVDQCIAEGVLVSYPGYLLFKHELFRLAIMESLSPFKRKILHRKILDIMLNDPIDSNNLSQLVHHAKCAEDRGLVSEIAPRAAQIAASVGAHIEASKLYSIAIENSDIEDATLVDLYECHSYECYLTSQMSAAIHSQKLALEIWQRKKEKLKEGNTLRLLSRLLWFHGRVEEVVALAQESVKVLETGIPTHERALAYSHLAQVYMLSDNENETLHWGQKAIDLAMEMGNDEVLAHALSSVGAISLRYALSKVEDDEKLSRSLSIALKNGMHEHVARGYANLSAALVLTKNYKKAITVFETGLKYCEVFDLKTWAFYMLSEKSKLLIDTGAWKEAENIAVSLHSNPFHPAVVRINALVVLARLKIRQGEFDSARVLIMEGKELATYRGELHRIIPLLTSELELCWITNEKFTSEGLIAIENCLLSKNSNSWYCSELIYWISKCQISRFKDALPELTIPYAFERIGDWRSAAEKWNEIGCPYEEALALFNGDLENQKKALLILSELGASATNEMLKSKLRVKGIKNIPRGPRESTKRNPAHLTNRQIDVLILLQDGLRNAEIADKLFISPKTVDHHISAILSQLDVKSRTNAVIQAQKLGIVNLGI